jgi:hypothetical protein
MGRCLRGIRFEQFNLVAGIIQFSAVRPVYWEGRRHRVFAPKRCQLRWVGDWIEVHHEKISSGRQTHIHRKRVGNSAIDLPGVDHGGRIVQRGWIRSDVLQFDEFIQGIVEAICSADVRRMKHNLIEDNRSQFRIRVLTALSGTKRRQSGGIINAECALAHRDKIDSDTRKIPAERDPVLRCAEFLPGAVAGKVSRAVSARDIQIIAVGRIQRETGR